MNIELTYMEVLNLKNLLDNQIEKFDENIEFYNKHKHLDLPGIVDYYIGRKEDNIKLLSKLENQ